MSTVINTGNQLATKMTEVEAPRLFGTDGIRMVVGTELTPGFISDVAAALATYLDGKGEVLIGRDFRTSSEAIVRILTGTLMMHGVSVRDMGQMPTPCLQFNIAALRATMGLTVTASHNPTEFNGIKFTGPEGTELPRDVEALLERSVFLGGFSTPSWERIGQYRVDSEGVDRYVTSIRDHVAEEEIRRFHPLVVLDPGNGTSAVTSPALLRELGCRVVTLNANPDGYFPGRPSEPTEDHLWALRKVVVDFGAQVGIAHDGDSDRAAFVDEKGRYLSGDVTLALFAKHRLNEHPQECVVTSVTSSTLIEDVVRSAGGRLAITRSGSLAIARGILENNATFGGEENGGYYWPEHQVARDGPMSSAKMVELLARSRRPLSELVDELPKYHMSKTKVPLPRNDREWVLEQCRRELEGEAERLITLDGVKAYYPDGWLIVRPSGTEPICRIYAEGSTPDRAKALTDHGTTIVNRLVGEHQRLGCADPNAAPPR